MKPFNFEEAKAGKPVCTRSGKDVRIICFDRLDSKFPIVALVLAESEKENIDCWSLSGNYSLSGVSDEYDLFIKPTKKEGWINIYSDNVTGNTIYNSKEEALDDAMKGAIVTIKIEWEE